ncbi:MAG: ABC transporter substrate-binding protein, partial [Chthoniobacterales bacterium]
MTFPYGKAPLWILVVTGCAGIAIVAGRWSAQTTNPDLVLVTFARQHVPFYEKAIEEFERQHGVAVEVQLVGMQALTSRLQSAMLAGTEVPDLVELEKGMMGYFTRGPLEDVGFVDLTDRLREEGLFSEIVRSRFSLWSTRDRTFALPHDVHPVMLGYRRDIVESLGIDVGKIKTWDDFVKIGRQITADTDGDGVVDRYAIDLPAANPDVLNVLILQRGGGLFDESGRVIFDSEVVADTICWYVRQMTGLERISFSAGWGQTLSKVMLDGLVVFYFTPDWRTRQYEIDAPGIAGKMALMPLPAWEEGGRVTSTWGGSGLAITKACPEPE